MKKVENLSYQSSYFCQKLIIDFLFNLSVSRVEMKKNAKISVDSLSRLAALPPALPAGLQATFLHLDVKMVVVVVHCTLQQFRI